MWHWPQVAGSAPGRSRRCGGCGRLCKCRSSRRRWAWPTLWHVAQPLLDGCDPFQGCQRISCPGHRAWVILFGEGNLPRREILRSPHRRPCRRRMRERTNCLYSVAWHCTPGSWPRSSSWRSQSRGGQSTSASPPADGSPGSSRRPCRASTIHTHAPPLRSRADGTRHTCPRPSPGKPSAGCDSVAGRS